MLFRSVVSCGYNGIKNFIDFEARILGDLAEKKRILSVSFIGGKRIYLLMEKENKFDFEEFLSKEEYETYSREKVYITEEDKKGVETEKIDIIYNLLFLLIPVMPLD